MRKGTRRSLQLLTSLALLYLFLVFFFEFPLLSTRLSISNSNFPSTALFESVPIRHHSLSDLDFSTLNTTSSHLHRTAKDAWRIGTKLYNHRSSTSTSSSSQNRSEEQCPHSIILTGAQFGSKGRLMVIPCGLTLGSHITLVARPFAAHPEYDPKITILKEGDKAIMVSQFMFELQGLKIVDGEDPPRILHFNPRLKGDWSNKPVIEMNTCYRMQWGQALRCEGWKSRADEETGNYFITLPI
ncbi:putative beta-1,3-galactosyltransferase 19 [Carex littledalei]|uniref:Galectin n=1 Tax=Carex littledalei TaxID=544730 RepID=A0A833QD67_9POAL|nr:putative beta-1,3-galactosyltransferase 19 [Carex littledalei]